MGPLFTYETKSGSSVFIEVTHKLSIKAYVFNYQCAKSIVRRKILGVDALVIALPWWQ